MDPKKRNASGEGGAHVGRAGGPKATNQKAQPESTTSPSILESKSTAIEVQRKKVIALLRQGPKTTIDLRDHGIMMPSTRVFELKQSGHAIQTELVTLFDAYGFKHRKCARYRLISDDNAEMRK